MSLERSGVSVAGPKSFSYLTPFAVIGKANSILIGSCRVRRLLTPVALLSGFFHSPSIVIPTGHGLLWATAWK